MNRAVLLFSMMAVAIGASAGLLWVHGASGPAPAPVTSLATSVRVSPTIVPDGGTIGLTGTTSIVGGPSPATMEVLVVGATGTERSVRLQSILKRDGTSSFHVPIVPVNTSPGTIRVTWTIKAGGKQATGSVALTVTGGDFGVDVLPSPQPWVYENDPNKTENRNKVTLTASIVDDPWDSDSYTYKWASVAHPGTGKALVLDGADDANTATFLAPLEPSASGQAYVVTCEVVGDDGWGWETGRSLAGAAVTVRLLGDANGDRKVTVTDFSIWKKDNGQTGKGLAADFNGDEAVTVADFSIWKSNNGKTCSD